MNDDAHFLMSLSVELANRGDAYYGARCREIAAALQPSPIGEGRAVADVVAERRRQIEGEGWSLEHDDSHDSHEMALAAACYVLHGIYHNTPKYWPWDVQWWKPKDRRSDLIRAAALLVAEIERLDRAASPSGGE